MCDIISDRRSLIAKLCAPLNRWKLLERCKERISLADEYNVVVVSTRKKVRRMQDIFLDCDAFQGFFFLKLIADVEVSNLVWPTASVHYRYEITEPPGIFPPADAVRAVSKKVWLIFKVVRRLVYPRTV